MLVDLLGNQYNSERLNWFTIFIAEHDLLTFFVKFIYNNKNYSIFSRELTVLRQNLDYFEGEWSRTRYPKEKEGKVVIPSEIYEEQDASEAIGKAKEVLFIIRKILIEKFRVE